MPFKSNLGYNTTVMERTEGLRYNPNIQAPTFAQLLREQAKWLIPTVIFGGLSMTFFGLASMASVETQSSALLAGKFLGYLAAGSLVAWPATAAYRSFKGK